MRKLAFVAALVALLALTRGLTAQEGHVHKVMGTITTVDATHLEIKTREGKKMSILLNPETKYLKGKQPAMATDVSAGQRVAVSFVEEKGEKTAKEVLLGVSPREAAGSKAKPAVPPRP